MSTASFPKGKPDTDPKDNIDVLSKPNIEIQINPDLLAQNTVQDPIIVPNIVIANDPVPSDTFKPENADNVVVIVISPAAKDSLIKDNSQVPIESTRLEKDNSKMIEPNQSESSARENITFTCPICYGEYETTLSKKLTCQHTFCKDCLELYIKTKIAGFEPASIRCPQSSCISLIGQETIEGLLDANSLEQYKKLIEIKSRFRNYQAKFCPQPGCSRELTVKSGEEFTQCQCGALICNQCFQIKHDGRSCADILRDNDDLYSNNKDVKMCIICKTKVEKTVGCSKVQCLVCDYVWCWDCGRESEPGHMMRCTRVWDPKAPEKLTKPKQSTCERIWSGLFLIIGMIFFILFMMIASLIVWPFIGHSVITDGKPNTSCMKILLAFLLSLLVWPLVVIVGPIAAAVDEYGSSMTGRKRWLDGGAKSFGLNNRQKTAQVNVLPEIRVPITENAGNQERNEVKEGLQNDVRIDIS